jgi:hypothetical protein
MDSYSSCGIALIIGACLIPIILPVWKPARLARFNKKYGIENKWEDQQLHPISQDFADMLGWKELTEKTERFYLSLPQATRDSTLIFAGNYGEAGALSYYGKNSSFKKQVRSINGSFILWLPAQLQFRNMIFIDEDLPEEKLLASFEHASVIDSISNPDARESGTRIYWFTDVRAPAVPAINKKFNEMKKAYQR